jgi:hypothetical protein
MYKLTTGWPQHIESGAFANPDSNYEYLQWRSKGNTPTPADIPPPPTYQELRAAAYPPMANYMDGIVKGNAAQVAAYVAACLAVKARYPKS